MPVFWMPQNASVACGAIVASLRDGFQRREEFVPLGAEAH